MILVLANRGNEAARRLAECLPNARLCTAVDLARPGWRILDTAPDHATGVASGEVFAVHDLRGIVGLMPAVFPNELAFIEPEARGYVAQEMTAFLRYFLSVLRCPALNRPTPSSLSGPAWRAERWCATAARAGVETEPLLRTTRPSPPPANDQPSEVHEPTWIGDQVLEPDLAHLTAACRAVARTARVDLLRLRFGTAADGRPRFREATPCPAIAGPRAAELVERYFERGGATG